MTITAAKSTKIPQLTSHQPPTSMSHPSGSLMAISSKVSHQTYGSSRLGEYRGDRKAGQLTTGRKSYELSNHLGNVLATVSDAKTAVEESGSFSHFAPEVVSTSDYYPFGLAMEGRTFSSDGYRWGFNGMEKDGQIAGDHYDFGARIYNAENGRWLSLDPLQAKYQSHSPYNFVLNRPIVAVDFDGRDVYFILYDNRNNDWSQSAITRRNEIQNKEGYDPSKDHIFMVSYQDLLDANQTFKDYIDKSVVESKNNNWGKTMEISFFGHSGGDGPVMGNKSITGKYDLSLKTENSLDEGQLSQEGWEEIDFNFDSENSIVCTYGCNGAIFAEGLIQFDTDIAFTLGIDGTAGGSNEFDYFSFNFIVWSESETVYMMNTSELEHAIFAKPGKGDRTIEDRKMLEDGSIVSYYIDIVEGFLGNASARNGKVFNESKEQENKAKSKN